MNLWTKLRSILPSQPQLVGTVSVVNSDGTLKVTMPSDGALIVRALATGAAVGNNILIEGDSAIAVVASLTDYSPIAAPDSWP